ncbi:globin domain-containing protein [Granulosicoccaceae sp. 1_MG-2023]|nr:globin domain-containing protein [Granulosicoccaceae sp. 1_MG-2023]
MSLSENTITIVKRTAPVIGEHGQAVSERMYGILFSRHPDLKPLFAAAPAEQSFKLAGAITAYAQNIDKLENLSGAVNRIVATHVRSGVVAEHYPVVADCLMEALDDVLGEAFTDDIKAAWTEAYQFLAGLLIDAEARLYAEQAAS